MVTLITLSAFTQAPQKMSYQSVIRNASGVLVTNQSVGIRISVLQGTTSGTVVYQETYNPNPQTNTNGLLAVEIGGGNAITGTFSAINWATGPYFLKTETDPTGGTSYTIVGTSQLLSVPYAFYSKVAETATDAVRTTGDQIISGIKTFTEAINLNSNKIINVSDPVNPQDASTKAYVDALEKKVDQLLWILEDPTKRGILKDIEGNQYNTIKIGNQIWMAENLRTTKLNDGIDIPFISNIKDWFDYSNIIPRYCWYNDDLTNKEIYGALYNWYSANTDKLCPVGWHVPNNSEWSILENYLGGVSVAGGKMKEVGISHWLEPNTGATDEVGFRGLPGGFAGTYFLQPGTSGQFWSMTESVPGGGDAYNHIIWFSISEVWIHSDAKGHGFSVRCLKD